MRKRDAETIKQLDAMSWNDFEKAELEWVAKCEEYDAHTLTDACIDKLSDIKEYVHLHERRLRRMKVAADRYSAAMKKVIAREVARKARNRRARKWGQKRRQST